MSVHDSDSKTKPDDLELGDRQGLDLLAAAVDRVADDLPGGFRAPDDEPIPFRPPVSTPARRPAWGALAASLIALVLAYPAYLGWTGRSEPAPVGGPVPLTWLSAPRDGARSAEAAAIRLELPKKGPLVWWIDVPHGARSTLSAGVLVELERLDEGTAESVLEVTVEADAWAAYLERSDGLPLWLDAESLRPGDYRLRLRPASDPNAEPSLDWQLRLTAVEP